MSDEKEKEYRPPLSDYPWVKMTLAEVLPQCVFQLCKTETSLSAPVLVRLVHEKSMTFDPFLSTTLFEWAHIDCMKEMESMARLHLSMKSLEGK